MRSQTSKPLQPYCARARAACVHTRHRWRPIWNTAIVLLRRETLYSVLSAATLLVPLLPVPIALSPSARHERGNPKNGFSGFKRSTAANVDSRSRMHASKIECRFGGIWLARRCIARVSLAITNPPRPKLTLANTSNESLRRGRWKRKLSKEQRITGSPN